MHQCARLTRSPSTQRTSPAHCKAHWLTHEAHCNTYIHISTGKAHCTLPPLPGTLVDPQGTLQHTYPRRQGTLHTWSFACCHCTRTHFSKHLVSRSEENNLLYFLSSFLVSTHRSHHHTYVAFLYESLHWTCTVHTAHFRVHIA